MPEMEAVGQFNLPSAENLCGSETRSFQASWVISRTFDISTIIFNNMDEEEGHIRKWWRTSFESLTSVC
jgi:hypothetical protein